MDLVEKVTGHCEIAGDKVEIVMMRMKKPKQKGPATLTPLRCLNSVNCAKSSFCRFVNPLTTRIPVDLAAAVDGDKSAAS